MAKRRELKGTINMICDELFAECVAASLYGGANDKENAESLLMSVVSLRNDYISRISHPQPGMAQKAYFRHLIQHFSEEASEIADHINNAS